MSEWCSQTQTRRGCACVWPARGACMPPPLTPAKCWPLDLTTGSNQDYGLWTRDSLASAATALAGKTTARKRDS